jgi:hypothetical protein
MMMKKIRIRDLKSSNFNKVKRLNTKFPKHAELLFAGMQANADECCVRILLGDNTGGGVVMLRPLSSSVSEFVFKLNFLVCCMHIWPYVYSIPTCAKLDWPRAFRKATTA